MKLLLLMALLPIQDSATVKIPLPEPVVHEIALSVNVLQDTAALSAFVRNIAAMFPDTLTIQSCACESKSGWKEGTWYALAITALFIFWKKDFGNTQDINVNVEEHDEEHREP